MTTGDAMDPPETTIDIFQGQLTPHTAHVYVRFGSLAGGGKWQLSGRLSGPDCQFAKTLPLVIPFQDLGEGPTLLARAVLTDPAFWSPELPATYRATIELRDGTQVSRTWERRIGMRDLTVRRQSFYWGGRRWVFRGMHYDRVTSRSLRDWRSAAAGLVADSPDDELCQAASVEGVPIVAKIAGGESEIAATLRRLAQHPAVMVAWLDSAAGSALAWRYAAPNLLLASRVSPDGQPFPEWAQVGVLEIGGPSDKSPSNADRTVPCIAVRKLQEPQSLEDARSACDALQSDLTPTGDFAGYAV